MKILINYKCVIAILTLIGVPVFAMTEHELKTILDNSYGLGPARGAGRRFASDYKIDTILGENLVGEHRRKLPNSSPTLDKVLSILNQRPEYASSSAHAATSHPSPSTEVPPPHPHQHRSKTSEGIEDEELARALEESRLQDERDRTRRAAEGQARAEADKEKAMQHTQKQMMQQWLRDTFLIGSDRAAVAGFPGVAHRLDIFNPLYGNHFEGAPSAERKAFPNVPIIHQYDPLAASNGAFFPLVVKLPNMPALHLQDRIKSQLKLAAHPHCEIYWTVQTSGSITAVGNGERDNIVYRPQYWAQPSGAPITFAADVHLLDFKGHPHHLGAVGYSIHDGVASPNAPVIPFQDKLRSGESTSFWSLISYGGRTALSLHWILARGEDITEFERAIHHSVTLEGLMQYLSHHRAFFSPLAQHMIDEIETILWQKSP